MDTSVNLNERETQILKAVIEEYMETAFSVGSETLDRKYNLGVSPATIRNEMVKLTEKGFLKQLHTSGGRTPTPKALKFYVVNLIKPKELTVAEEVAVKQKVWDCRHELNKLLKEATAILAKQTKALSLITTEEGDLYYAGTAYILQMPEFYNIDLTKRLFFLLEEFDYWNKLFYGDFPDDFRVIVGNEMGEHMEPCGLVYTKFKIPGHGTGTISVIGSNRLNYGYVIPVVKYIGNLLTEISTF